MATAARPVVAVAGGRAFTFRYAETDELLRAAGYEPVVFDPLTDSALPAGAAGLYLGGGFPEVHATELSGNAALRADIAGAVAAGLPTIAECAGLLYLCESVDGVPMVGALPGEATMSERLTLGYRAGVASHDHLLGPAGTRVHGHEFHRTVVRGLDPEHCGWLLASTAPAAGTQATPFAPFAQTHSTPAGQPNPTPPPSCDFDPLRAFSNTREIPQTRAKTRVGAGLESAEAPTTVTPPHSDSHVIPPTPDGYAGPDLHASYLHVHWAGHPELAKRFADAVQAFAARGIRWEPGEVSTVRVGSHLDRPGRAEPAEPLADLAAGQPEPDLNHHGDAELAEGLIDLAVNVRVERPPRWLSETITATVDKLAAYPDPARAMAAIGAAHPLPAHFSETVHVLHRHADKDCNKCTVSGEADLRHLLPTAGAAEAFTLIACAFRPNHAVVVHPQFTEPEAALRAAGHDVCRLLLRAEDGFRLDPDRVPAAADLVVIGNPTNPTSVLHPREIVRSLLRPGRLLVVDEAFMDAVPGEPATLLDGAPLDGVLVLRSLTKTWGVAGLRAGYVVGDPSAISALRAQQPPWSVSTPALAVIEATLTPKARRAAAEAADEVTAWREILVNGLAELGLPVVAHPRGPYVLADVHPWETDRAPGWLRVALRERGFAVRRCDTFPGLDPGWLRIAVRDPTVTESLLKTLRAVRGTGGSAG